MTLLDPFHSDRLDRLLEAMRPLVIPLRDPPAGFDLLQASAAELAAFGLMPRPDPVLQPRQSALWHRMMAAPLHQLRRDLDYGFGHRYGMCFAGQQRTSRNWSGAVARPSGGAVFNSIMGSWIVPEARRPQRPVAGQHPYACCSTWIGLGGDRRCSSTLPQLGTAQVVPMDGGKPHVVPWIQWWVRGQNYPPLALSLHVEVGDEIIACITLLRPEDPCPGHDHALGSEAALFQMKNQRSGDIASVGLRCPAPSTAARSVVHAMAPGASAEWVAERPSYLFSDRLLPLANCGTVVMPAGAAGLRALSGEVAGEHDLAIARRIRMFETVPGEAAPATIVRPLQAANTALVLQTSP